MEYTISAILLAAGLSRRMGGEEDKLLLPYNSKPILQNAIDVLAELSGLSRPADLYYSPGMPFRKRAESISFELILVTTPDKLKHVRVPGNIRIIINNKPDVGQSESIRLGVKAATGDVYFFMSADQPLLTMQDIKPIIFTAQKNKNKIIYPTTNGRPINPVIFPAEFKKEFLSLTGDTGGREIRNNHPEFCIAIEVENPENFKDINNKADYYKLFSNN